MKKQENRPEETISKANVKVRKKKHFKLFWRNCAPERNIPKNEKQYIIKLLDNIEDDIVRYKLGNLLVWYHDKSKLNKRVYFTLNVLSIICNALIPIFNMEGVTVLDVEPRIWTTCFAAVAGISLSTNALFGFKDNWVRYRGALEKMKHSISMYLINQKHCCQEKCV